MGRRARVAAVVGLGLAPSCSDVGTTSMQGSTGVLPTSETTAVASGADGSSTGATTPGPLVDLEAWTPVAAADDPWAAERPAEAVCEAGFGVEDMVFEVDTEICTFGTFVQPTLLPVRAGDAIELLLVHDALYSEAGEAEAHVAIALDGVVAWETTIAIPTLTGFVRPTFEAPVAAPAGTLVHFHVHNHGYNNYRMVELTVL